MSPRLYLSPERLATFTPLREEKGRSHSVLISQVINSLAGKAIMD